LENLVFLDESGVKTNMTRLYGRSFQGTRCNDSAPNGHWERVSVLSSIRLDGSTECIVIDGSVDRQMFDEYIKQILSPTLRPGDILVMDNLRAHKSQVCEKVATAQGARVKFLPAYSPDLNPIEKMWSKLKQTLRGMKARTNEELCLSVGAALDMVTSSDARGWFKSCGYV
jgi:transposase